MKTAARAFEDGTLPAAFHVAAGEIGPELRRLASAFVALQQARHEADYDVGKVFARQEVLDYVDQAEQAFDDWEAAQGTQPASAFLVCLLLKKRVERR